MRVLTVHGAKGLEAPAVFLVNTAPKAPAAKGGWKFDWPSTAAAPQLVLHAGVKAEQDALSQTLMAADAEREAQENLHLLYVAATRARQYLFISGFALNAPKPDSAASWHSRCRAAVARLKAAVEDEASTLAYDLGTPPECSLPAVPRAKAPVLPAAYCQPLAMPQRASTGHTAHDPAAVLHGRTVHALLQALSPSVNALPTPPDLHAAIARQLQASLPRALFEAALAEAQAVLAAPALAAFFQPQSKAWNELPLLMAEADGSSSRQVIDRLVDDGERLWVLDYKTRPASAQELLQAATPQLRGYVAAVEKLFPGRLVRAAVIATASASWAALEP